MSDKLSKLSREEIDTLISRYYGNERVADLIKEYKLDLSPSSLVNQFPPEILDDKCIYCDVNIIKPRMPKTYHSRGIENMYCPNCKHDPVGFCLCNNCQEQEQKQRDLARLHKQAFIDKWITIDEDKMIDLDSLTFTDRVYLGALLREGLSEDCDYIMPIIDFVNPIAPTDEFITEIIQRLFDIKAIVIHPNTDYRSIEIIDYENGQYNYYPREVKLALNIRNEGLSQIEIVESLISPTDILESDYEEAFSLWKKNALYESIEFFLYLIRKHFRINYSIGEKTKTVLNDLLNDYSVAQIYRILYYARERATLFESDFGATKRHASNTIIGKAQSYGEYIKSEGKDMFKYKRIKECPESALSRFLFERILKIGNRGFNEKPSMSHIAK